MRIFTAFKSSDYSTLTKLQNMYRLIMDCRHYSLSPHYFSPTLSQNCKMILLILFPSIPSLFIL